MQPTCSNFRVAAAFAAWLPAALLAQTAPSPTAPATDDEVVRLPAFSVQSERDFGYRKTNAITATRLGTDILSTPLSVSVVSRELLDDLGVDTTPQMFGYTANVITNFDNQTNILAAGSADGGVLLRGFRAAFIYQDSVRRYNAFHIDGVDRVEVVKGPVALYFGRSDPGGIVNFITKKPDLIDRTVVELKYGSDNFYKAMVDHQGTHRDGVLGYRVVGSYRDSDSWMAYTHWKEKYLLTSAVVRPTRRFEALLQYERVDQEKTGGRVPAFVANLDYLREAGVFGGPNTLKFDLVDGDGNPNTPPIRLYESQPEWARRKFTETGKDYRDYNGHWFPRGHTWNRNGDGTFDNNKSDSFNLDLRAKPVDALTLRALVNYTETDARVFWFINQDPHQAPPDNLGTFYAVPAFLAALVNNGDPNLFTGMNYGFFESPFFNRRGEGGGIPGRQQDLNDVTTVQLDLAYDFEAFRGKHTLVASFEAIYNEFTQYGYVTDIDKFIQAGGFPANWPSDGFGPIAAASQQLLNQRIAQLQQMGVIGASYPQTIFSGLWGNMADPNFVPPRLNSWLAGRTANSVNGNDSYDRGFAAAYRGRFAEERLQLSAGVRRSDFRARNARVVGGKRERTGAGWVKFSETTPTIGALVAVKPDLNLYASYSENFFPRRSTPEPLIRNSVTGESRGGSILPPETGTGVEVGVKTFLDDGRISGAVALFRIDRENMPLVDALFNRRVVQENEASGGANPWRNETTGAPITAANAPNLQSPIGRQRVEGFEVEGVLTPNRSLQVVVGAAWNFTREWLQRPPSAINVANGGTFTGRYGNDGRDAMPKVIKNVPEFRIASFAKYTFQEGRYKGLHLAGGVQWQSENLLFDGADGRFDAFARTAYQGSYAIVDLSVGYPIEVAGRPLRLQLAVNNALDKEYVTGTFGPAPVREWKITARYEF